MTEQAESPAPKRQAQVRYYRFRNVLKDKAGGGLTGSGAGAISAAALQAAEAEFEKAAEDYPDWVGGIIQQLYEQHGCCVDTPELRHQLFRRINEIAHDLKGQGGTFGYDLVSSFGHSLYEFTRPRELYSDNEVEIVRSHIDAMKAVISGRIKGNGGEIGKHMMDTLHDAIEKYSIAG